MTLAALLPQKLAEWHPPGEGRHSLALSLGEGWAVYLTADRVDSVGCLLWEVTLTRTGSSDKLPTLSAWAESAAKAAGLLEPLSVIEVDVHRSEALLRSAVPSKRGGQTAYYDLVLHDRDRATLRRMRVSEDKGRREQVAFALTHESLVQFVEGVVRF